MSELLFLQNSIDGGPGTLVEIADKNGVSYEVADTSNGGSFPNPTEYGAVVMLGDPKSVQNETPAMKHKIETVKRTIESVTPYLGICLGLQVGVKAMGGTVYENHISETGFVDPSGNPYEVSITEEGKNDPLLKGLPSPFNVFETHDDTVLLTPSMTLLGEGDQCKVQVVKIAEKAYGLQPHIELNDSMFVEWTKNGPLFAIGYGKLIAQANSPNIQYAATGEKIFTNFLQIAGLIKTYSVDV